jgi:hypothetical protein
MTIPVSDARSNANDQIAHAARVVGSGARARVFEAISFGKKRVKTVDEIAKKTRLDRKAVLTHGRALVNNQIVRQVKRDGVTAYEKDDFYAHNKKKILEAAADRRKLEAIPTKTSPKITLTIVERAIKDARARVRQVTVDDIDSFSKVRSIADFEDVPILKEREFKAGIQRILGEKGEFSDWGGERNDLFTTRVRLFGRRVSTAFAFKGPGQKGRLTPAKLGRNGDQIQRLFQTEAGLFIVQYWEQVDQSVPEQMRAFAAMRSAATGEDIYFGVIDGADTDRLVAAYERDF